MGRASYIRYAFLILTAFALDQATKALIVNELSLGEIIAVVPGFFNLTYIRNPGIAFGFFAKAGEVFRLLLIVVPVFVTAGLFLFLTRLPTDDKWRRAAVSLVLGGALSNLMDRVRLGYVVDFLDFHWKGQAHYPSFNAADAFICVGVALLILKSEVQEKKVQVRHV